MAAIVYKNRFDYALHQIFEFGVFWKFFNGVWETASGLLIIFSTKETLSRLLHLLAARELLEDPNDYLFNLAFRLLEGLSSNTQHFIAVYVIIHGCLNLFLAIQLYRERVWAYLATILVMSALVLYQIYRIILFHSPILAVITVFDVIFILLAWREYRFHRTLLAPLA